MDVVAQLLLQQGVSLASQTIYDFVKKRLKSKTQTVAEIGEALEAEFPSLSLDGAKVIAQTVVDFFAEMGFIAIRGSHIYAGDAVWMRSAPGTKLTFGDDSVSETDKTRIEAKGNARIEMSGGAQVRQNPDGSISFLVPKKDA